MQTLKLRSRVDTKGNIQQQRPEQLANQEVNLILVYQPADVPELESLSSDIEDPLVGLFAASPNWASQSEALLKEYRPKLWTDTETVIADTG